MMSFVVSRPHSLGYVAYGSALDTQAHIAQLQTVPSPESLILAFSFCVSEMQLLASSRFGAPRAGIKWVGRGIARLDD